MKKSLTIVFFLVLMINTTVYAKDENYEVHFLDTKQSDCILIKASDRNYLIDTGNYSQAQKVIDYLNKEGITKIDSIVITHYHDDHFGGLKTILSKKQVGQVLLPDYSSPHKSYIHQLVKSKGVKIGSINKISNLAYKKMNLKVIAPKDEDKEIVNNNSIILVGQIDGIKYGFLADCEKEEERYLLKFKEICNCDIVKIPHHGLDTSSTKAFIKALNPKIAVITSDGVESPSEKVIKRVNEQNSIIYRTDKYGSIVFVNEME